MYKSLTNTYYIVTDRAQRTFIEDKDLTTSDVKAAFHFETYQQALVASKTFIINPLRTGLTCIRECTTTTRIGKIVKG